MDKILALDIDETVVQMWPMWRDWCIQSYGWESPWPVPFDYNLCSIFGDKAIDFWSDKDLYYNVKPMNNCVEVLEKMKAQGWAIGFVSYTKKGHFESKCDWVNKWVPFRDFIHCTKEKGFTRCTHFMDDRNKYLNQQPDGVTLIKMQTPLSQEEQLMKSHFIVDGWFEFEELWMKGGLDEKRN